MRLIGKGVLTLSCLAAAALSSATLNYSNVVAQITFDGSTTYDLSVMTNGNSIDFSALDYPMFVSTTNSPYSSAVVTITYDVTSDDSISGLGLIFTGMTYGNGSIDYSEIVKDAQGNVLDSISGNKSGNGAFVESDLLSFTGRTEYSVEKTFTLSLGLDPNLVPAPSLAAIGLIEQNAVPEPATLGAVGVGLIGFLARRRRR